MPDWDTLKEQSQNRFLLWSDTYPPTDISMQCISLVYYRLVWSTAHKQLQMVGKMWYEKNVATNNQHHDKIESQIKYLPAKWR